MCAVLDHIQDLRIGTVANIAIMFSMALTNKVSNEHKTPSFKIKWYPKVHPSTELWEISAAQQCLSTVGLAKTCLSNEPQLRRYYI